VALFIDWEDPEEEHLHGGQFDPKFLTQDPKAMMGVLHNEFEWTQPHKFLLDRISAELRLTLNKEPLKNQKPQIEVGFIGGCTFRQQEKGDSASVRTIVH